MSTVVDSVSSVRPASPAAQPQETRWHRFCEFVLHRRVRITAILFATLILEDAIIGVRPHGLANFNDLFGIVGLGLVLCGLAVRSWAAGILHKRTQLTTSGPYGIVRHPLYIGSYLMMVGFCVLIDDVENIWIVLGPILALYIFRAIREERTLAAQYGPLWDTYAKSVPRFLPLRWPKSFFSTWSLKQWVNNGEYNAVAAVALGLVAIQIWHLS
jgi:protein-S-isoprenylcysteine O-methyltransferase Ste14